MDKIAVVPNEIKDKDLICTKNLINKLKELNKTIFVHSKVEKSLGGINEISFLPDEELYKSVDVAMVVGGDGSIIRAARRAALENVPVIGVNMGRLGYLAQIEPDELYTLADILNSGLDVEKRMMLSFEIFKLDGSKLSCAPSLNDIVFTSTGNTNRLVDIKMSFLDSNTLKVPLCADGIIISTPTGSTAYSLAAGGPVVDPVLECITAVAICPHSLSSRPMIFSSDKIIKLLNDGRCDISISADGADEYIIKPGEYAVVRKSEYDAGFVKVSESSFYEVLRKKMAER